MKTKEKPFKILNKRTGKLETFKNREDFDYLVNHSSVFGRWDYEKPKPKKKLPNMKIDKPKKFKLISKDSRRGMLPCGNYTDINIEVFDIGAKKILVRESSYCTLCGEYVKETISYLESK